MYKKRFHCWKYQYLFVSFSFFYVVRFSLKFFKSRIPKKKTKELVFFNFSGEYYPSMWSHWFQYLSQILGIHLHIRSKNCFKRQENVFISGGTDCRWEGCIPGSRISQTRGCRTGKTQDQRNTSMRASASHFLVEKLKLPQPSVGFTWSSPSVVRGGDWEQERGGPGWPVFLLEEGGCLTGLSDCPEILLQLKIY